MKPPQSENDLPAGPERFINRELSWLEFNRRVLDQALDPGTPLLERVNFFCIFSTNLDEFFEVRVAGLKQQVEAGDHERSVDGATPLETLRAVQRRVRYLVGQQYRGWRGSLLPALAENRIRLVTPARMPPADAAWVAQFYQERVRPVLTPLAIDPTHPFPHLVNKSLNLIVRLEIEVDGVVSTRLAVVQSPPALPRLLRLPKQTGESHYVFLGDIIGHFLSELFPGATILGYWHVRVTRNSELYIEEEESSSLIKAVENELHNRRKGAAVRLEVQNDCPLDIRALLLETLRLGEEDLYVIDGPIHPVRLLALREQEDAPELRHPLFIPVPPADRQGTETWFETLRRTDVLLHHPYESFEAVSEFIELAARDRDVLAIKLTLYRAGNDPRILDALIEAARRGKQVTAVIELRARFDEASNIQWARALEDAGAHVVYGLVGYKIHAKMCLVVRHDPDGIRRYLHLSTGNYNPLTARIYTDLSLLTANPDLGEDATQLFNLLTGICHFRTARKLWVAPFDLHARLLERISRETEHARRGLPARIMAKINSLAEPSIIDALYQASQAGVNIDLAVRGICCLRPGLPGVSGRITVRSIVDRFLEHSRIYYFENSSRPEVFVGSADWMPRNFFRRIEIVFPIDHGVLRDRVISEILDLTFQDNVQARLLSWDGAYYPAKLKRGSPAVRSQFELIARARGRATRETSGGSTAPPNEPLQLRRGPPRPRARPGVSTPTFRSKR